MADCFQKKIMSASPNTSNGRLQSITLYNSLLFRIIVCRNLFLILGKMPHLPPSTNSYEEFFPQRPRVPHTALVPINLPYTDLVSIIKELSESID